jgi:hypothetical protein
MATQLQMRRPASALPNAKQWQPCCDGTDLDWWQQYDRDYNLTGWEYRTVKVKEKKQKCE